MKIDGRDIGPNHPPYVVAELSANHNGSLERALVTMEAAQQAGADAVKLQTYTPDTMTIDHDGSDFQLTEGPWAGQSLYQLYQFAHTPWEWHETLFNRGRELGITVFSTPFDNTAVDFLDSFDPPAYKIASFELVDLQLIEYVAKKRKPLILSTGMADKEEINDAVLVARNNHCIDLCLLHCTSGYPTPVEEANLVTLRELEKFSDIVPGLSDHTLSTTVSVAAVALGACIIEKHFTLSRSKGGPDAQFSIEPTELQQLVEDVRTAHKALGTIRSHPQPSESTQLRLRRSLYVVANVRAGESFTKNNVRAIRPGFGLPPRDLPKIMGKAALKDIPKGTPLSWQDITLESDDS